MSNIQANIQAVEKLLASYWPLPAFIATNPLWDLVEQPFHKAMHQLGLLTLQPSFYQEKYQVGEITDAHIQAAIQQVLGEESPIATSLSLFLEGDIQLATNENILYAEQVNTYQHQPALNWVKTQCLTTLLHFFSPYKAQNDKTSLRVFWEQYFAPKHYQSNGLTAEDYIQHCLDHMGIPQDHFEAYAKGVLLQLYGWSSLIKWQQTRANNPWVPSAGEITTLIMIWLSYESQIYVDLKQPYQASSDTVDEDQQNEQIQKALIWQTAYENSQYEALLSQFKGEKIEAIKKPVAQLVFCIDTRSEGLRRHLEQQGPYQTFGFAGFFGFIFRLKEKTSNEGHYQCPALIDPDLVITYQNRAQSHFKQIAQAMGYSMKQVKSSIVGTFSLFEMFGFWVGIKLACKSFLPCLWKSSSCVHKKIECTLGQEIEIQSAVDNCEQLLRTIGLTGYFAPTVVLCAHQSCSDNNPFAATLDCGACGGNSGIPNAIMAVTALNHPEVRAGLKAKGIEIPQHTTFIVGCHHTTRDEVTLMTDKPMTSLEQDLSVACANLRVERLADLPGDSSAQTREVDWAELMPELGLINNMAMIVGPRTLTQSKNLGRRVFLHSYEPDSDPKGEILAGILAAPVVVGHWINAQYYFSTVRPDLFGAGNKALHNVVPNIGVMEGNLSDLKIGLPEQSIRYRDQLIHQPVRLLVVINAKQSLVDQLVKENNTVQQLVSGGWIALRVIEP